MPPRKIASPPVRVNVWVRVSFGVGGQFSSGAIVLEPYTIPDRVGYFAALKY